MNRVGEHLKLLLKVEQLVYIPFWLQVIYEKDCRESPLEEQNPGSSDTEFTINIRDTKYSSAIII